jgi:O-antigen ligase
MAQLAACVGALGAVLVLVPRRREATLAGLCLVAIAIALIESSGGTGVSGQRVALVVAALPALGILAYVFVRYPGIVPAAVLFAAPFRLPLDFGARHRLYVGIAHGGQVGRLLPLYAVLGAAALALAWRLLREGGETTIVREIAIPVSAFAAFASVSFLWSDAAAAARNLLAFFLLPFVILVAVVARAPFAPWLPRVLALLTIGLAGLFALVGLVEEATHRLIFYTPSVVVGNAYSSFFRVTSLFRDPSLYGRHVVLGISLALVLVWYRKLGLLLTAGIVALLFAGLFFSYSQSSFAALFAVGLFLLAVAGDRPVRLAAAGVAVLILATGAAYAADKVASASAQRVTSDRSRRIELTARVFAHHPLVGVGIGAQPRASQAISPNGGPPTLFVSHTTPLTVGAELGVIGLALYALLLGGAVRAFDRARRIEPGLGLSLAAVFVALFVHALFYSGFFEDPLTWLVLGLTSSFLAAHTRETDPA